MGIKDFFKKEDNLTKELRMLPPETKRKILDNVNRRRNEILEERLLEKQLKSISSSDTSKSEKRTWSSFKDGMKKRREELKEQGILKPIIRYNKENFESPIERMSKINRANEIKRLENQRNKLKQGYSIGLNQPIKLKELKLKSPDNIKQFGNGASAFFTKEKKRKKNHGFI